jgi:hypothetical protein
MLFSHAITAMVTYLCDAFYQAIMQDDRLIERLMTTNAEFTERKYALSELIGWSGQIRQRVTKYLSEMMWHNLFKVRPMYDNVLGVKFPDSMDEAQRDIAIRHDCVHRNGRTKDHKHHRFLERDLIALFNRIGKFVTEIHEQVKRLRSNE